MCLLTSNLFVFLTQRLIFLYLSNKNIDSFLKAYCHHHHIEYLFLKFIYLQLQKGNNWPKVYTLNFWTIVSLTYYCFTNRSGNKIYIPQKGLYPSTSHTNWMNDATNKSPTFLRILSCLICLGCSSFDGNNQPYNKQAFEILWCFFFLQ